MNRKKSKLKFVNLHGHSCVGSPFDALGYPQEYLEFAYENGLDAHATTEHGNMNSFSYIYLHTEQMNKEGRRMKPIYGVEAYFHPCINDWILLKEQTDAEKKTKKKNKEDSEEFENEEETRSKKSPLNHRRHLVLLAQNQTGLNNLFKLVSESHKGENFYRFPRMDFKMLEKYNEGVVVSSACLGGYVASSMWEHYEDSFEAKMSAARKDVQRMVDIFGERFFLELQWNAIPEQHIVNKMCIQLGQEFDIPLISTVDHHYPRPELWQSRVLYKRLGWQKNKNTDNNLPETVDDVGYELYPKNGDEVYESYLKYSQLLEEEYDDQLIRDSIEKTYWIAHELIEDFTPDTSIKLPSFLIPEDKDEDDFLKELAFKGLRKFNLHDNKVYVERLNHELRVISSNGFSGYFITMKAIVDKAWETRLVGPARGSAAGSLVAYVLRITQIDPIKFDLPFSRFMTADASGFPDIDTDFESPQELRQILIEEWGTDNVAPISNFNTLKLKSLIKDIAKYYEISFAEVNRVTSVMIQEATPPAKERHNIKTGVYNPTYEEVKEFSRSLQNFLKKYPKVETHIQNLLGNVRSTSRHAGGLVLSENIGYNMPLIRSKGVIQTPWSEGMNVRHLEPLGFIKFDILGLETLEMIRQCISNILGTDDFVQIRKFYKEKLHPDVIVLEDQKVYENVFHQGKWAGIFQFTNSGAQSLCIQCLPRSIDEISIITSIYRPGPLGAGVDKDYVASLSEDAEKIEYEHPVLEEVLGVSNNFIVFQEQIMKLATLLGDNITEDDSSKLRKLLTKKGLSGDKLAYKSELKKKFIEGSKNKGFESPHSLWERFEYFAQYGFAKCHASSYSVISYQCAWLMTYYEAEWLAAFLDKEPDDKKEAAIGVAKSLGYRIEPLNVNTSGRRWSLSEDKKTLIQPLTTIKGLGDKAITRIEKTRPFKRIEDIILNPKVPHREVNKKSLDVLARSGALNCLLDERFTGMKHMWTAAVVDRVKMDQKDPQKSLDRFAENIVKYASEGEFSAEEKIEYLASLTGVFPLRLVISNEKMRELRDKGVPPISEYDSDLQICWFIPREIIPKKTKKGKNYWVLKVTDSNSAITEIKCWGIKEKDRVFINRPYAAILDYDVAWGFSTRSVWRFKLLS